MRIPLHSTSSADVAYATKFPTTTKFPNSFMMKKPIPTGFDDEVKEMSTLNL